MKTIPVNVSCYWKSPEFTEETVPHNLLESHRTKAETWAKVIVLEGTLRYRILAPEIQEYELSPARPGIVEPDVPHQIEAIGRTRFYVEFYS